VQKAPTPKAVKNQKEKRGNEKMSIKQFNTAQYLLDHCYDMEWIGKRDYNHIMAILCYLYEGQIAQAIVNINKLETLPREKTFKILQTVGNPI
jgi:hypothetical protein